MQYNNPTQQFVDCWIQSFLKKNAGRNFRISMKRHKTHETFDYGQAIAVFRWEHHGITVLYHLSGAKIQFMLFSVVLLIISCWVVGNTQKAIVTFQHHHMKQWIWSNQQEQASPMLKHFCSVDPLHYFSFELCVWFRPSNTIVCILVTTCYSVGANFVGRSKRSK